MSRRRRLLGCCLLVGASRWSVTARAQDGLLITNLDQLVAEAYYSPTYCFTLPEYPWSWQGFSICGGEPWWLDCTAISCSNLFQSSTNLDCGVTAYSVVMIQDAFTGYTTIQPDGLTNVAATVTATVDEPSWLWNYYWQVTNCPDCWGLTSGDIPPPTITVKALLADASDYAAYTAYQSNQEAEAEAAQAASAGGGFFAMDDDGDGGDPCSITNLTQPFYVNIITQSVNRATTITWQSCQMFRYLIWEANSLSTNTQWIPAAYVWGSNNFSSTMWTDTATTNDDGSTVTQRFYRVQRLLGTTIAAGADFSAIIDTNGALWTWGSDENNDLGDGDTDKTNVWSPIEVSSNGCNPSSISMAAAVAAGEDFGVAVDSVGAVWSWGAGSLGVLGNGSSSNVVTPTRIGMSNVVSVAASDHVVALCTTGTVFSWGNDLYGDDVSGTLGSGHLDLSGGFTNRPIQSLIPTNTVIVAVAAGNYFSLALDNTGLVWGWGDNEEGQIGTNVLDGSSDGTNLPTLVAGLSNVIAIAAGGSHTLALTSDKRVWTLGADDSGQLGWNANQSAPNPTPQPVPGLSNVVAIAGGFDFSVAVTSNGFVYAWGNNNLNALGTNGPSELTNATIVGGISNAVQVGASLVDGGESFFALAGTLTQGTNKFYAWGNDDSGQIGNNTNVDSVTPPYGPVPFTYYNSCAECIQLGTNGTFTAYATGTLFLYFNDDNYIDNSGSYTATVYGVASNVVVPATGNAGVLAGPVVAGSNYAYSATGICHHCIASPPDDCPSDPTGTNPDTDALWDCPISNFLCPPPIQCYSLIGKVE